MMTESEMKYGQRNSKMLLDEVYFWTDTIKDWHKLLDDDFNKNVIIDCWRTLVNRKKIKLYAFVIMPNHIHAVWEMVSVNGKEMPYASFNKFTAHQFLERLRIQSPDQVMLYKEYRDDERNHRFWQRDPLTVYMDSKHKVEQKIEYIHRNPLQEQWNLVSCPKNHKWSSARFYETGTDEFSILTDYRDRF